MAPGHLVCRRHRRAQTARFSRSAGSERLPAERVVDLTGLYRRPGFHRHDGPDRRAVSEEPAGRGQPAHAGDHHAQRRRGTIPTRRSTRRPGRPPAGRPWRSSSPRSRRPGMPLNVVQTVGHTQVRRLVLGDVDRQASPAELERMKGLVREAMEAGAIGLSTALDLPAGRVCVDRRDRRARPGRRRVRRELFHPHAERGRPPARGDRRGPGDRQDEPARPSTSST